MDIIELFIDEENEVSGIDAISIVENPAIEEDFIALKNQEFKLAEVDKEKRILMGPALIPNKPIFRKSGEKEYYIYFSRKTVEKASQLFFKRGNQNRSTLEHELPLEGLSVVESWIVESEKDKSRHYDLEVPIGTWMISMKVDNDDIWENYIKSGKIRGFSIEAYFSDRATERPNDQGVKDELAAIEEEERQYILSQIRAIIKQDKRTTSGKRTELESFNDYPQSVANNAKRGIELNKKNGNKCATNVGKIRAQQLSQKKPISEETLVRMYSYLSRAEEYYDESDSNACGTISFLLWGGLSGKRYAESKLRELGKLKLDSKVVDENYAIIDDRLAYSSKEKAIQAAKNIGCEGFHVHDYEGNEWFMPCEKHIAEEEFKKYKCPPGYVKDYQKHKCVKKKNYAEIGPKGGIKKSPKAPKSDTPNKNPKGKGTAKGDASTSRGAKVSEKDLKALQKKSDEFNERYKEKLGYGVTVGQLKAVFQRGLGAFNTSHSPRIKSPTAWAQARVNAYLYLVRNGRPQNPKYTGDFDLLPKGHPKSPKK